MELSTLGSCFKKTSIKHLQLTTFSNSDWVGDRDDKHSTTEFVVFLGSNLISWGAKKQTTVSRSSTEAEYRASVITDAEICWLRQVLKDLQIFGTNPPQLLYDNNSAI